MQQYLGLLLLSFGVTSVLMVPFINLLFKLHFAPKKETKEVREGAPKAFYEIRKLQAAKVGVLLSGGGILMSLVILVISSIVFALTRNNPSFLPAYPFGWQVGVLLFTFGGFGLLGLYDDMIKIFGISKSGFFGLRMRHKLLIQWAIAIISAAMLTWGLDINFIYVPFFGIWHLGWLYFPLAAFLIVAFANAFDITDGLDGLSCGLLFICLTAFAVISMVRLDSVNSVFLAIWQGTLLAFLYFNVYPARIMLSNMGGLAFGATLGLVALMSGKTPAMMVIASVFLIEGGSSMLQLFSKRFMKKRIFPIAPIHHWMQLIGWEEPVIVARAWMLGIFVAALGIWLAFL